MGAGLAGGPLTGGPVTAVGVIAPTGQTAYVVSPLGAGATDVAVKVGSSVAGASLNASAKLLSVRAGIGATETEYVSIKGRSALGPVLTIDTNNETNVGALLIAGNGAGFSGIWFNSLGEVCFGLGSGGTRGLYTQVTNRTQSWLVNSGAFSPSARAIFDWEAAEDAYQKTIPFSRYQADALHTADLARWYIGSTLKASLSADGIFTGSAFAAPVSSTATLQGALGAGGTDVVTVVGTTVSDGGTHATAHLLSVRTGLGGTEVEKFWVTKSGPVMPSTMAFELNGDAGGIKLQYRTSDGMCGLHNGAAAWLGLFPGTGASGCSGTFTTGADQIVSRSVQLNTTGIARPAASASTRGTLWYSKSAGGVADTLEVCLKSAADTYSWVTIATG